ncbi:MULTISPECIES: bifunctional UDP-N-acetylglucosamine diphosphorylase/glucosamine-1-phosphate N-acetyltransferase GlmU [Prochlorococcus]|uniref:bifunctional UDP-N-acetylglucosamine diphosphorylase/glucosamine-1-phosphate N-acetyltransferase GlmU n=1 Tax=Prochlorococcus TaxID=1218 RepID=UPI0005339F0C|nr:MULTISPECIES: bifunctional UDP-N-acetylglucosamine diphosphorylase/glucosamine-1-phosphate N-acetyltransferase GlmU [Prochlorococcus]KGG12307.1 N-acetylglucosamine-1-phosphate uridyltransferase [Prochlorococcus sp. MIT 0601]
MLAIAILAAGKGTRMHSNLPKVLQKLAGKSLIKRVLGSCNDLKADRCIVVVGHKSDQVKQHLNKLSKIEYVLQEPQIGTGHAVQKLIPLLEDFAGDLLVLNGDVPLLKTSTLKKLISKHKSSKADVTFLSASLSDPKGYGRVFGNREGIVRKIVEDKDCSEQERKNNLTNSGVYCFKWKALRSVLPKLSSNNEQNEIYLTDVIKNLPLAMHFCVENSSEVVGINDRSQLANCEELIQIELREKWMNIGVTFIDAKSCTISEDCHLGRDIIIEPQTHIRGECRIGDNCIIGPNTLVENSFLGNNVKAVYSVIKESNIGNSVSIGPFSHLRPGAVIFDNCRIGNFVEIKKSELGKGTKVNHLSYIGDSKIGKEVNIGAGTITANYDGYNKNKTYIGNFCKTGANSVLIAPITLGEGVTVGAGSTLTKNVPDGSLAIARSKQLVREGWQSKD